MPAATATRVLTIIPGRSPDRITLARKAITGQVIDFTTTEGDITVVVSNLARESGSKGPWESVIVAGFVVGSGKPFKAYYDTRNSHGTLTINPST